MSQNQRPLPDGDYLVANRSGNFTYYVAAIRPPHQHNGVIATEKTYTKWRLKFNVRTRDYAIWAIPPNGGHPHSLLDAAPRYTNVGYYHHPHNNEPHQRFQIRWFAARGAFAIIPQHASGSALAVTQTPSGLPPGFVVNHTLLDPNSPRATQLWYISRSSNVQFAAHLPTSVETPADAGDETVYVIEPEYDDEYRAACTSLEEEAGKLEEAEATNEDEPAA